MPTDPQDLQLIAYIDHELDEDEQHAVEAALEESAELRGMLSMLLRQRLMLAGIHHRPAQQQLCKPQTRSHRHRERTKSGKPALLRFVPWMATAAALVAALIWYRQNDPAITAPQATALVADLPIAEQWSGEISWGSQVMPGQQLAAGDSIELPAASEANLSYPDGTRLRMSGPAAAEIRANKAIFLKQGTVWARVAHQQTGDHFTVDSPYGSTRVVGTRFTCTIANEQLTTSVSEGVVEVRQASSGKNYTLRADESIEVGADMLEQHIEGTVVELRKERNKFGVTINTGHGKRNFVPEWSGGMPNEGGGFNKQVSAQIKTLSIGQRVRIQWHHDGEHPRADHILVLE